VRYAMEVCSQLGTLHAFQSDINGRKTAVVHGDIKPTNIQIGPGDKLRLLDFGIAKVITFTHNLTHHNLGSPTYCSPERISKAQVDPHADLWALASASMKWRRPPALSGAGHTQAGEPDPIPPPAARAAASCPDRLKAVIFRRWRPTSIAATPQPPRSRVICARSWRTEGPPPKEKAHSPGTPTPPSKNPTRAAGSTARRMGTARSAGMADLAAKIPGRPGRRFGDHGRRAARLLLFILWPICTASIS